MSIFLLPIFLVNEIQEFLFFYFCGVVAKYPPKTRNTVSLDIQDLKDPVEVKVDINMNSSVLKNNNRLFYTSGTNVHSDTIHSNNSID